MVAMSSRETFFRSKTKVVSQWRVGVVYGRRNFAIRPDGTDLWQVSEPRWGEIYVRMPLARTDGWYQNRSPGQQMRYTEAMVAFSGE